MSIFVAPRPEPVVKAAIGAGAVALTYGTPLWQTGRTPQRLASQAQALYHEHPWVHRAEASVSGRASGVEWHLEDDNDDAVTDESPEPLQALRNLLEKPQDVLPLNQRQTPFPTWRWLTRLTTRHMGLCGTGFWYLDQVDALAGLPLSILYINPARMWEVTDKNSGNLLGWTLDKSPEDGGTPLRLEEVLPFYLDPPDRGYFGIGIVESAGLLAQLATVTNRHMIQVLGAGGRLAGQISPKQELDWDDNKWGQLVRDYRGIVEDDNAAKRLQILKAPMEYTRTGATMQELAVTEVAKMSRDDIFAKWGVPVSQAGIALAAGLNSGETKRYDEAVLWQGAIHDRLHPYAETIQLGLLDRAKKLGINVELVINEPEFDDETPKYDLADKAASQPLMDNERRELLGLDPLPDYALDGSPLGVAIRLPSTVVLAGVGPSEKPTPRVTTPILPQIGPGETGQEPPVDAGVQPAKAGRSFLNLRHTLDGTHLPPTKKAIADALRQQARDLAQRIREKGAHIIAKRGKDQRAWWNSKAEDARILDALRPHATALAKAVTTRTSDLMRTSGKAENALDTVPDDVLAKLAGRVGGINETTREAIARLIEQAVSDDLGIDELADLIEASASFDDYRAELISRTELAQVYNAAALSSYGAFGVASVTAIDGDKDAECAARDGVTYALDDAENISDHPNGTLDWVPVLA